MWNIKYRFSFCFYIYLYATDRWTFLKHLFHHIIFLLENIKSPRCDLEERGDYRCKHVIPLPLAPKHPYTFWGCGVLCVSFLPTWRKGGHRAAPEASGYCSAMHCPFLLWSFLHRPREHLSPWDGCKCKSEAGHTSVPGWQSQHFMTCPPIFSPKWDHVSVLKKRRVGAFVFFSSNMF